jgi:hypothetical protein
MKSCRTMYSMAARRTEKKNASKFDNMYWKDTNTMCPIIKPIVFHSGYKNVETKKVFINSESKS